MISASWPSGSGAAEGNNRPDAAGAGWCYLIHSGNKPRGPEAGACDIEIIMLLLVLHSSGYSGGAVIVGTVQRDVDAAKDPVLAEVALATPHRGHRLPLPEAW